MGMSQGAPKLQVGLHTLGGIVNQNIIILYNITQLGIYLWLFTIPSESI